MGIDWTWEQRESRKDLFRHSDPLSKLPLIFLPRVARRWGEKYDTSTVDYGAIVGPRGIQFLAQWNRQYSR